MKVSKIDLEYKPEMVEGLLDHIDKHEAALRHIIAMAGNPDAVEACRLIINRAKQALGEK